MHFIAHSLCVVKLSIEYLTSQPQENESGLKEYLVIWDISIWSAFKCCTKPNCWIMTNGNGDGLRLTDKVFLYFNFLILLFARRFGTLRSRKSLNDLLCQLLILSVISCHIYPTFIEIFTEVIFMHVPGKAFHRRGGFMHSQFRFHVFIERNNQWKFQVATPIHRIINDLLNWIHYCRELVKTNQAIYRKYFIGSVSWLSVTFEFLLVDMNKLLMFQCKS